MKCYYHSDADGLMSAMWVFSHVGIEDEYEPEFIAINYTDIFPLNKINKEEQIYIVDFSIEIDDMYKLLEITNNITWIDHHKTSIEKYKDFPINIRGLRYDGIAGCELTYAYIHHMTQRGSGKIKEFSLDMLNDCPMSTRYIGDRDVWKYQFGDDTRNFYDGWQLLSHDIEDLVNYFVFEDIDINKVMEDGKLISKFKKNTRKSVVSGYAYEVEFHGYECLVCNSNDRTSELFGGRFDDYDLCSVYSYTGEQYSVSLYSQKIDVSEIAKIYGGGGHKGASGFQCKENPFPIKRR